MQRTTWSPMLLLALLVQVSFLHAVATSWLPPGPEAVALQASIDAAIVAGSSEIVIQPGVYSFNSAAMNITDARDLRVRVAGNGRSAERTPYVYRRIPVDQDARCAASAHY